jgi:hypothetical protein
MKSAVLLSCLFVLWDVVAAVRLPVVGKRHPRGLERRDSNVLGTAALTDDTDVQYTTNITLGGVQFTVLIDTGRCATVAVIMAWSSLTFSSC